MCKDIAPSGDMLIKGGIADEENCASAGDGAAENGTEKQICSGSPSGLPFSCRALPKWEGSRRLPAILTRSALKRPQMSRILTDGKTFTRRETTQNRGISGFSGTWHASGGRCRGPTPLFIRPCRIFRQTQSSGVSTVEQHSLQCWRFSTLPRFPNSPKAKYSTVLGRCKEYGKRWVSARI